MDKEIIGDRFRCRDRAQPPKSTPPSRRRWPCAGWPT